MLLLTAVTLLLLLPLMVLLLQLVALLLTVFRLDLHFSVAATAKEDGLQSPLLPPNRGPDAFLHAIRNSDRPVLHMGSPSKSNMSCNNGFFTWLSTSQSLPSAGLRFTYVNTRSILVVKREIIYVTFLVHVLPHQ